MLEGLMFAFKKSFQQKLCCTFIAADFKHVCCIWVTQEHFLQATHKQFQKSSLDGLYTLFLFLFLHVCVICFTLHFSLHLNPQYTKYYMKVC